VAYQDYYEANREAILAQKRGFYAANKEKIKAKNRKRYATPEVKQRVAETVREWAERNPERYAAIRQRASLKHRLRTKYGMSVDDYDAMLAKQGGCCAVCRTDDPGGTTIWCVDHDHETGEVRGLLCRACNIALGAVRDRIDTLRAMIAYLQKE
jgi:Recombination endonuclease VII